MAGGSLAERASSFLRDALPSLISKADQPLVVLRVSLTFPEGEPEVTLNLTPYGGGTEPADKRSWKVRFSALGTPTDLDDASEPRLELPLQVTDGLKELLAGMNVASDHPLWLDLMRPYGFLGVAPWESVLGKALGRPILRLPDFPIPPREGVDVLEAVVLFDAPSTTPAEKAVWQSMCIADGILASSSRLQTRVNLFAGARWAGVLQAQTFDTRVRVHQPPPPPAAESSPPQGRAPGFSSTTRTPWTDWVCTVMNGRSVDVVHFACAAEANGATALLALSDPRSSPERPLPTIFGNVEEIGAMLTRLAAWGAIFSPPPDGSGRVAMTFLADAFAHSRPGPVLCHRLAAPDDPASLRAAYELMFSGAPTRAPTLSEGFLYRLPDAVVGHVPVRFEPVVDAIEQNAELIAARTPLADRLRTHLAKVVPGLATRELSQAPNWAGAVQRYVETAGLDQIRRVSGDVLLSRAGSVNEWASSAARAGEAKIVRETLADIQSAVAEFSKRPGKL